MNADEFYWNWPLLRGDGLSVDECLRARDAFRKSNFPARANKEVQEFVFGLIEKQAIHNETVNRRREIDRYLDALDRNEEGAAARYESLIRSVAGKKTFDDGEPVEGFALELHGDDRRRYEEIRAARERRF